MSKELIGILVFGTLLIATVIYFIVINVKHKRRQKIKPSAHRGEYQSQKGRVYDPGVSYRSSSGEWGNGAGTNLTAINPAWGVTDASGNCAPSDSAPSSSDTCTTD